MHAGGLTVPYIYNIEVNEKIDAATLEKELGGPDGPDIDHSHSGVCVAGRIATVSVTQRFPQYLEWKQLPYIDDVTGYRSVPKRNTENGPNHDFQPPYDLHPSGLLRLEE